MNIIVIHLKELVTHKLLVNISAFSNSSIILWPCQVLGLVVHMIALLIFALDMGLVVLSLYLNKEEQGCSSGENACLPRVCQAS